MKLKRKFYKDRTLDVAKNLLGKFVVRKWRGKEITGMIVETEAYIGPEDKASHAFNGKMTQRNKAEYLKMIFKTNNIEITDTITANPYADVAKDAWYAPYAYLTNRKNILDVTNNRLNPSKGMTRADVAETIYRLKHVLDNNLMSYSR